MFNMRHKSGRQKRVAKEYTRLFLISVRVGHRAETSGALCMPISRRRGVNTLNSTRLGSFVYRDNAVSPLKDVEVFLAVDATTRPVVPAAAALECAPTRQLAEESVMRDQLPLFKDTRTYSVLSRVGPSSSLSPRARAPHQSTSR